MIDYDIFVNISTHENIVSQEAVVKQGNILWDYQHEAKNIFAKLIQWHNQKSTYFGLD